MASIQIKEDFPMDQNAALLAAGQPPPSTLPKLKIRNKATGEIKEIDPMEAQNFGLDPGEALNRVKALKELEGISTGTGAKGTVEQEFKLQQVGNSISELEKLYGRGEAKNVGTKQDLSLSPNSTAFGKLQGKGDAAFKSFTDSGYQEDLNRYNAQLTILKGVFTQALGSGAPTGQEGVDLINSAPGADATDEEAKGWFESIRNVAGVVQKELGQPGTNQKKNDVTSGFQNIEPGAMDSIQFSGDQPQDQTSNADEGFKATDLIPILGSIIGGIGGGTIAAPTIAGIPAGVIAGGAAGAGGGEFIRQNIEGESDALNVAKEAALGGIGGPIGKGAGFIAGKTIVPAVKTGAKIA